MTIYIVKSSWGSWDDYRTVNEKAFYTKENAEEFKTKYELIEREPMEECPVDEDQESGWTHQDYDKWQIWFDRKCEKEEFNGCLIEEVELL